MRNDFVRTTYNDYYLNCVIDVFFDSSNHNSHTHGSLAQPLTSNARTKELSDEPFCMYMIYNVFRATAKL